MKMLKPVVMAVAVGMLLTVGEQALGNPLRGRARDMARARKFRVEPLDSEALARAEEEYFQFLRKNLPSEYEELKSDLENLKNRSPEAYNKRIAHASRRIKHLEHMKQNDPESFERSVQLIREQTKTRRLGKAYREAESEKEKEKIKADLKENLDALFDMKLAGIQSRVEELEEQMAELKKHAEERKKNKDEIVRRRLDNLTAREKGLEW